MPLRNEDTYKIVVENEPKKVTEIRNKILNTFNKLVFVDEGHKYFLGDKELCSVSVFAQQFEEKFDTEQKAIAYAEKHGGTPEYWMDQWRLTNLKATVKGTQVHAYAEGLSWLQIGHPENIPDDKKYQYIEDKGWLIPTRPQEESALKFWNEFPSHLHVVLPETKVYTGANPNIQYRNGYAGTFDLLVYDEQKDGLTVYDWKGLDINTPIYTKNGWKTMGTVQVGDIVYDKNGNETRIIHTSEIHNKKCYNIIFDNNTNVIADYDHRWEITYTKSNKNVKKILTTEEIFQSMPKKRNYSNIPKIEITSPIDGDDIELSIDPYVLGVWLGDGHSRDGKITNMYDEIFEEIHRRGFEIGKDVSKGHDGKAKRKTIFGLSKLLKENNLILNKHIPDIYFKSSFKQKLELLNGLMDTDGYYNPKRKRYVFSTTKTAQVDFCVKLLGSMGIKTTVLKYIKKFKNKKIQCYDVAFTTDIYPFKCRKVKTDVKKTSYSKYITIKNVIETETIKTRCIEVDSQTHTFLFDRDFKVTHNTNAEIRKEYARSHSKMMYYPFNDLYMEPLGVYNIQLNAYAVCLEDIGLKVIAKRIVWLREDGTYEVVEVGNEEDKIREIIK